MKIKYITTMMMMMMPIDVVLLVKCVCVMMPNEFVHRMDMDGGHRSQK